MVLWRSSGRSVKPALVRSAEASGSPAYLFSCAERCPALRGHRGMSGSFPPPILSRLRLRFPDGQMRRAPMASGFTRFAAPISGRIDAVKMIYRRVRRLIWVKLQDETRQLAEQGKSSLENINEANRGLSAKHVIESVRSNRLRVSNAHHQHQSGLVEACAVDSRITNSGSIAISLG